MTWRRAAYRSWSDYMGEGVDSLRYAVRLRVLAKYLGQLGVMLTLLNLAPLLVAILYREWSLHWRSC